MASFSNMWLMVLACLKGRMEKRNLRAAVHFCLVQSVLAALASKLGCLFRLRFGLVQVRQR